MFVWPKDDLNAEQVSAVTEPGSVFLVACPGERKDAGATYKIAVELSKLTSERTWVVAITYTNRAADEIHERIECLGVDTAVSYGSARSTPSASNGSCAHTRSTTQIWAHGFRVIDCPPNRSAAGRACQGTPQRLRPFECNYYF